MDEPEEPEFKPADSLTRNEEKVGEDSPSETKAIEKTEKDGENASHEDPGDYEALYSTSEASTEGEETVFEASAAGGRAVQSSLLLKELEKLKSERDELARQLTVFGTSERGKEQSFQEIAKELEQKCFTQQEQIESLQDQLEEEREKLVNKDTSTEQLEERCLGQQDHIESLQEELAEEKEKATRVHADILREKEALIGKLALLEEERKKLIDDITSTERREKEAKKETEKLQGVVKKQKSEIAKLQASYEKSEAKAQESAKLKEEVSSLNIKVKWAQNKLKTETEAHKETKSQLTQTSKKLKETREEGEQIRADLKRMITQYQESEEMRSNSLGVQLKKTEKELKLHEQEIVDQQQLHDLTVKELELTKTAHKIAQEECQQLKSRVSELSGRVTDQGTEIDELKAVIARQKQDQKKLTTEMAGLEQLSQGIENERTRFSSLHESHMQLQRSAQHLEREVARRKAREQELLAFSEKLSSANAELQTEKSYWESKLSSLQEERDGLSSSLVEAEQRRDIAEEELGRLREETKTQLRELLDQLDNKSKAVEQLSMCLEEEREQSKALRKKNASNIKDLQRQLQQCKRRIEVLESSSLSDREPPAMLPINEESRASSQMSLDGIGTSTNNTSGQHRETSPEDVEVAQRGCPSPSPELFQSLDQEKMLLVERLCQMKKVLAKKDERMEFYEEHSHQLTEDIQRKARIIQNFIMRERSGALAPPSYDEHKLRHSRRTGIMAAVFSGRPTRANPEMTLDISLEMNRKMQSVLEDTLLKNITLKENIDTLGKEIQRLSAQLQAYENSGR